MPEWGDRVRREAGKRKARAKAAKKEERRLARRELIRGVHANNRATRRERA